MFVRWTKSNYDTDLKKKTERVKLQDAPGYAKAAAHQQVLTDM